MLFPLILIILKKAIKISINHQNATNALNDPYKIASYVFKYEAILIPRPAITPKNIKAIMQLNIPPQSFQFIILDFQLQLEIKNPVLY